jgi:orotidine-5'-phosphate decarboxylase
MKADVKGSDAANEKVIVPLDVPDGDQARRLIEQLRGQVGWFKVGLQLFTAGGPSVVREIQTAGSKVFLDLKFHDIPNAVKQAVASACALEVEMLTIHLAGGIEMCTAAIEGSANSKTLLLGVTVLTSQNDATLAEIGVGSAVSEQVLRLAELAHRAGIKGLVASPQELQMLRAKFGAGFTVVTPGVRPAWSDPGDQKRVLTPAEAIKAGADYLVIGRPITGAPDPGAALARILEEIEGGR